MGSEIVETDLALCEAINAQVRSGAAPNRREVRIRVLRPETSLGDSLDFGPKLTTKRIARGYQDAQKVWPQ
jgi:hypothetical protein